MKKSTTIKVIVIAAVLLALALVVSIIVAKISGIFDNSVPIVDRTDTPDIDRDAIDPNLEDIEGTPDDIGVDYYPDVDDYENVPIYKRVKIDENVINFIMVGQDATLQSGMRARSDSMMIVSYNRAKKTVRIVSIVRDTWVQIEGHRWNRINAAYSFGGIGLLLNTVNDTFELDIQDYAIIGFNEFQKVIDRIGGVTMKITAAEASYLNGALRDRDPLPVKNQSVHMDGKMALVFARCRRVGGVFERDRRQREMLLEVYKTLKKKRDIETVSSVLSFALDNVKTNMPMNHIFTLAMELLEAEEFELYTGYVPFKGEWKYARIDGKSVVTMNRKNNVRLLHEFLYPKD